MIWMLTAKALGTMCLVMLGGGVGALRSRKLKEKEEMLGKMAVFLQTLCTMLEQRPDQTETMLERAANVSGISMPLSGCAPLPERLKARFSQKSGQESSVPAMEWNLFSQSVLALCTEDTLSVCRRLDYTRQCLEQSREQARECARTQGRLYRSMGIAAGAAASLLLM